MYRIYHGHSMKGTFRKGDVLSVEPVPLSQVRPGDVIVFLRQRWRNRDEIVHRVMRRVPGGFVTRGDAVAYEDAGVLHDSQLVGRVCHKIRNNCSKQVHGGGIGLWQGRILHCYWALRRKVGQTTRTAYGRLSDSGIARRLWNPRITRVMIGSAESACIHYICNKRIVARYWPDKGIFECPKPWDLVIGSGRITAIPNKNQ